MDRERTIQECLNILSHCYIYSEHTRTHAHISIHAMRHSQLDCVQVLLIYVILRAIPVYVKSSTAPLTTYVTEHTALSVVPAPVNPLSCLFLRECAPLSSDSILCVLSPVFATWSLFSAEELLGSFGCGVGRVFGMVFGVSVTVVVVVAGVVVVVLVVVVVGTNELFAIKYTGPNSGLTSNIATSRRLPWIVRAMVESPV